MALILPWRRRQPPQDTAELLAAVYRGDRSAAEALMGRLAPVIQKRVAWVLSRRGSPRRADVLDYTQEVLVRLWEDEHHILKTWTPDRGAKLETFVALVAERLVLSALRSGRKSGWREDPTLGEDLARKVSDVDLEQEVWSRDLLTRLLDRLEEELTPRSRQLFSALFVEELPPEQVAEQLGMSLNALYSWRSRFKARMAELVAELESARG